MTRPELSLVVPVYNEEENVERCAEEISSALAGLSYEVIWVDDGSRDRSPEMLEALHRRDPRHKAILFRRNYGQTAAMAAGFKHASGRAIAALDADLQNDPADIPWMLEVMRSGFDVVSGWRKNRKDTWVRKLPSRLANLLIARVTGTEIHDYGCTLKLYDTEILRDVDLYGEMHRFIPALAAAQGARVTERIVNHRPRLAGASKYGISRVFRVCLDILTVLFLTRFLTKPLHFFGGLGLGCFALAGTLAAWTLGEKLAQGVYVHRNPLFMIACIVFMSGLQLVVAGLLGEVIARSYFESQGRSTYRIRGKVGL